METLKNLFRLLRQKYLRYRVLQTNELQVTSFKTLIIAPHPDDETFGCAGLIQKKKAVGAEVSVVFLTYGENSLKEYPDYIVRENRQQTAKVVSEQLNIDKLYFCDFPDGGITHQNMEEYHARFDKLSSIIEEDTPDEIFCTHPLEGWKDHTAASEITQDILKKSRSSIIMYHYWVWVWFSVPFKNIKLLNFNNTYFCNIQKVLQKKQELINIYLQNLTPEGTPYCGELPTMFINAFQWPYEVFEKVDYQ